MAGCINQLIKNMLRKFLVANISHPESMKHIRKFTIVDILGEIPY